MKRYLIIFTLYLCAVVPTMAQYYSVNYDKRTVAEMTAAFTTEALERMSYQAALGIVEVLEERPISYPVNQLHNSFEENKHILAIMNCYRYEFQQG